MFNKELFEILKDKGLVSGDIECEEEKETSPDCPLLLSDLHSMLRKIKFEVEEKFPRKNGLRF